MGQTAGIIQQSLPESGLKSEEEHLEPVASLEATEQVTDQLGRTSGRERLPVAVPVKAEYLLEPRQSSHL
jgi:hypothetical protein